MAPARRDRPARVPFPPPFRPGRPAPRNALARRPAPARPPPIHPRSPPRANKARPAPQPTESRAAGHVVRPRDADTHMIPRFRPRRVRGPTALSLSPRGTRRWADRSGSLRRSHCDVKTGGVPTCAARRGPPARVEWHRGRGHRDRDTHPCAWKTTGAGQHVRPGPHDRLAGGLGQTSEFSSFRLRGSAWRVRRPCRRTVVRSLLPGRRPA